MDVKKKHINIQLQKDIAERLQFLRKFKHRVTDLNDIVERAIVDAIEEAEKKAKIRKTDWVDAKTCPSCTSGVLSKKVSGKTNSVFFGCSRYPHCKHTESIKKKKGT